MHIWNAMLINYWFRKSIKNTYNTKENNAVIDIHTVSEENKIFTNMKKQKKRS